MHKQNIRLIFTTLDTSDYLTTHMIFSNIFVKTKEVKDHFVKCLQLIYKHSLLSGQNAFGLHCKGQ